MGKEYEFVDCYSRYIGCDGVRYSDDGGQTWCDAHEFVAGFNHEVYVWYTRDTHEPYRGQAITASCWRELESPEVAYLVNKHAQEIADYYARRN